MLQVTPTRVDVFCRRIPVADNVSHVYMLPMAKHRVARASVFTPRQNRALRAALRTLRQQRDLSQMGLGRLLGIAQQNAGRLLTVDDAGFSYDTATRLVRELGFAGVDTFFASKGIAERAQSTTES